MASVTVSSPYQYTSASTYTPSEWTSSGVSSTWDNSGVTSPYQYEAFDWYDPSADLEGYGAAQKEELQKEWQGALSKGMQGLTDRGLSATTIAPSVRSGYTRQETAAENALAEQVAAMKVNAQMQLQEQKVAYEQAQDQLAFSYWNASQSNSLQAWSVATQAQTTKEVAEMNAMYDYQQAQQQQAYNYWATTQSTNYNYWATQLQNDYQYSALNSNAALGYAQLANQKDIATMNLMDNSSKYAGAEDAALFAKQAEINAASWNNQYALPGSYYSPTLDYYDDFYA